jgi:hypothetical protein
LSPFFIFLEPKLTFLFGSKVLFVCVVTNTVAMEKWKMQSAATIALVTRIKSVGRFGGTVSTEPELKVKIDFYLFIFSIS